MDPLTAFAVAQGAIKGIKAAIQMGKDVQSITGDVMKFFDAKDKVAKEAVKDPKKKYSSDTSQAMSTVMQLHELNKAEEELKWHFINQGHSQLWSQILLERNSIVQRRRTQEILDARAAKNRKQEIDEAITMGLCILVAAAIISLVAWGVIEMKGKF
jgi:vesicle coat complex subunit